MALLSETLSQEFDCEHAQSEVRKRVYSNGTTQYHKQCLRCGRSLGAVSKQYAARNLNLLTMRDFDNALTAAWYKARTQRFEALRHEETRSWFREHNDYLSSPGWQVRRTRALRRDKYLCLAMMPGCTRQAEQVHHLTYTHWRNEPLFDLISVCGTCHEAITQMDRERRGAA